MWHYPNARSILEIKSIVKLICKFCTKKGNNGNHKITQTNTIVELIMHSHCLKKLKRTGL